MTITLRRYNHPHDYKCISEFLIAQYLPGNADGNWIEPAWEYMHGHPQLDSSVLDRIGIWEDDGRIAAVVHYEDVLGDAFLELDPKYRYLIPQVLDYAEEYLSEEENGVRFLRLYINNNDPEFMALAAGRGYQKTHNRLRPMYRFDIPDPFPPIPVADGFRLKSLADECDWGKVHRALYRGFDHGDDPDCSPEELESRRKMFDTATSRRDLKMVVEAPDGEFVSFCGMFYEPHNHFAYVEPVATDPKYRRLGLGKAAVLEGIRRCGALGATAAYVGSNQLFYQALGFYKVHDTECWKKEL